MSPICTTPRWGPTTWRPRGSACPIRKAARRCATAGSRSIREWRALPSHSAKPGRQRRTCSIGMRRWRRRRNSSVVHAPPAAASSGCLRRPLAREVESFYTFSRRRRLSTTSDFSRSRNVPVRGFWNSVNRTLVEEPAGKDWRPRVLAQHCPRIRTSRTSSSARQVSPSCLRGCTK